MTLKETSNLAGAKICHVTGTGRQNMTAVKKVQQAIRTPGILWRGKLAWTSFLKKDFGWDFKKLIGFR